MKVYLSDECIDEKYNSGIAIDRNYDATTLWTVFNRLFMHLNWRSCLLIAQLCNSDEAVEYFAGEPKLCPVLDGNEITIDVSDGAHIDGHVDAAINTLKTSGFSFSIGDNNTGKYLTVIGEVDDDEYAILKLCIHDAEETANAYNQDDTDALVAYMNTHLSTMFDSIEPVPEV